MKQSQSILVGEFDEFVWIRCEGRGNFTNSPLLKRTGETFLAAGRNLLVVDLDSCLGMDSTFMGTLAGLAMKLKRQGGRLQIARANEKNEESLRGLGLDLLLEINPEEAPWLEQMESVRNCLEQFQSQQLESDEQAQFCLDAHQELGKVNPENPAKFKAVVEMFESEVALRKSSD